MWDVIYRLDVAMRMIVMRIHIENFVEHARDLVEQKQNKENEIFLYRD